MAADRAETPKSAKTPIATDTKHELFATCAPGIEDLLERELKALGAGPMNRVKGGVFFSGSDELLWRACLELRTGSRIQRIVWKGAAKTEKQVADALLSLDLDGVLRPGQGIGIELHDAARPIKTIVATANSIERALNTKRGARAAMARDMREYVRLVVHRRQGELRVGIDAAGKALHKRGWRADGQDAPIQESLAAALILLTGFDGSAPFVDPFCGSGTIPIEAAYVALGKAPLVHRKKGEFAFERFADFEPRKYRRVLEEIRGRRRAKPPHPILAADLDPKKVKVAAKNAERARVGHQMTFAIAEATSPAHRLERGVIVANLPYGVRVGEPAELPRLYRLFARTLTDRYADWKGTLLVPKTALSDDLASIADRTREVKNGKIDCLALSLG